MFTEQDVKDLDGFAQLIANEEKTHFTISAREAVQLVKYMNFINALRKKVSDNILEYRAIHQAVDPIVNNTGTGE